MRPNDNTYWVNDHLLAGEYPGHWSDAVAQQRLQTYLACGITCFVDLTQPGELARYDHMLPDHAPNGQPVEYVRKPIRDLGVPRSSEFMAEILDTIDQGLANGHTVYVHCWGGIGRTGTVVGCYLVRHGRSGQEALADIARHWQTVEKRSRHPHSPEEPEQMAYVRLWSNHER
jgi:protein-tyrosine phosphatase